MFLSNNKVVSSSKKRLYQVLTIGGQIPAVKPWPQRKRSELSSQVETFVQNGSGGI